MKSALVAALLLISTFTAEQNARAQWLPTNGPSTNGKEVDALATIGTTLIAGGYQGVYQWVGDTMWTPIGAISNYINAIATNGNDLFAGGYGGVYSTNNFGQNWATRIDSEYVFSILLNGVTIIAGTDNGVLRSPDYGVTWSINTNEYNIFTLATIGNDLFGGGEGVSVSDDNGMTWNALNDTLSGLVVNTLAVSGADLFAGTNGNGIFLSQDNGATWTAENNDSIDLTINAIEVIGQKIFAGTAKGVYLSTNNGTNWLEVNDSLPEFTAVYSFTTDGTYLYAGTGNGVYSRVLTEFNGVSDDVRQATSQNVLSVFPNPFTQSTTIHFTAQASGTANITIVNLLGSNVATLFVGALSSGEHSFTWEGNGLPAGMYECVIQMGDQESLAPILLTR